MPDKAPVATGQLVSEISGNSFNESHESAAAINMQGALEINMRKNLKLMHEA